MDHEIDIFELVHYAQMRLDSPIVIRNWLSDPTNNANITDDHDFTLLHWAVIGGIPEIVTILLDNGARPNVLNAGGDTPLHLAAQLNRHEAAQILLRVPDIMNSTQNLHGNTPLHYATFFNCHQVAISLVESGASLTVTNNKGFTPLKLASEELATRLTEICAPLKCNTPSSVATPMNLNSPGLTVTDGAFPASSGAGVGIAALTLRDKMSESRYATCWLGTCDGKSVVARSVHLKRKGPMAQRLAVQLLSETERLKTSRGTLSPHPNILPLLTCMLDRQGAGEPLLLSRYQQLGSLFNILHAGSLGNQPKFVLDQRQAYKIALNIANGMEYIHGTLQDTSSLPMPRFHLNSRNVLLDIDSYDAAQEPIARLYLAKSDLPGTTDPRKIRHPAWYSPEELLHPPHIVRLQPADMWSMGVVLFELVTLCVPFFDLSAVEIGIKVALEGARVHQFSNAPGLSAHVERLLGICMNENPECRPTFDQIVPVFERMVAAANANAPS